MKTTKTNSRARRLLRRGLPLLLLLVMLGGMLTSCTGGSSKITTIKKNYEISVKGDEGNGLTAVELNELADKIAKHKQGAAIREQLVAALNGYDMNAAGFDDSRIPRPGETVENPIVAEPEKAAEFAMTALRKAEIEVYPYMNGETVRMTKADVEALVMCFQIEVETDAKLGVLDQVLNWIGIGFGWLIDVPGFGSFILGTLYFAIILEIVMLPLAIRQQKNSKKQAMLRPREMAIRNKYRGRTDQVTMQKLNQEIQKLYQDEGYSPMAGCLPLLITMPFLIFLYYIVIDPLTYMMGAGTGLSNAFLTFADASRAAGGLGLELSSSRGTIEVLSLIRESGISLDGLVDFGYFSNGQACFAALDGMVDQIPDFSLFGLNMGLIPVPFGKPYVLMIIPVLTFVVYWGSGKITRKFTFQPAQNQGDPAQGCSNTMMNVMMPMMSAFFTFMVPAAVGIYWMFKSIVGTVKTIIVAKLMPLPTFTEEDYKAAERELAGKDKNKPVKKSGTRNPNVRSLHHIDDEDYETATVVDSKKNGSKSAYVEPKEEKPTTADNRFGEGATLKEEARPEERKSLFGRKNKNKNKKNTGSAPESSEPTDTDKP